MTLVDVKKFSQIFNSRTLAYAKLILFEHCDWVK